MVVGEGEATLAELVRAGGAEPGSGGGTDLSRRRRRGPLQRLPGAGAGTRLPAVSGLRETAGYPQVYRLPIFNYPKAPNTSCISSRGCPYACSYCDRTVFRRGFRYNSAEYLYAHLRYLREAFGIRHVNFYDDQFTFNRERVKSSAPGSTTVRWG